MRAKSNCLLLRVMPLLLLCILGCSKVPVASVHVAPPPALSGYPLTGSTRGVHDPSVIRQGATWYVFSTDGPGRRRNGDLPILCSEDAVAWRSCGYVFQAMPAWIQAKIPGIDGLWAPDISYFGGVYHLYYAGSTLGSERSVIGLATNVTLNPTDPAYRWQDQGEVLESEPGDDANAIDPNAFVDTDGRVWLSYGSYWRGIKQRELDARSGKLLDGRSGRRFDLARRPGVPEDPIEGASLVKHDRFYYLFVSIDYCCNRDISTDNYKEAVGRATSPHGPFLDQSGVPMLKGGGTVLLASTANWRAPGGGTAWVDPDSGQGFLVFHALDLSRQGRPYLWFKSLKWVNEWPVIDV